MPNLYARATALPNIVGRIDYVASHHRQEHLLATYDGAAELLDGQFWRQLANECQTAFEQSGKKTRTVRMKDGTLKTKKLKCCQGRELVLQLSNSLLDRMTPQQIAKTIADELREKEGLVCLVAIHFNKDGTNLHAHVIFPERQLLEKPVIKTADRNLFFDATGKRCYKKAEILDANKQLLPGCRIVKKGEAYEQRCFSTADEKFSRKAWLRHLKTNVILPLRNGKLRGDVEITEYDKRTGKLAQQHVGKSAPAKIRAQIKEYNEVVKIYNAMVDAKQVTPHNAAVMQKVMAKAKDKNATLQEGTARLREIRRNQIAKLQEQRRQENQTKQQNNNLDSLIGQAKPVRRQLTPEQRELVSSFYAMKKDYWNLRTEVADQFREDISEEYYTVRKAREGYENAMALLRRSRGLIAIIAAIWAMIEIEAEKAARREIEKLRRERDRFYEDMADYPTYIRAYERDLKAGKMPGEDYLGAIADAISALERELDRLQIRGDLPAKKIIPTDPDDR